MLYLAFWIFFLLPLLFFAIVWRSAKQPRLPLVLLTLSATLLIASTAPSAKHWLLGADYSDRLYASLGTNLVLVMLIAGYLAFKRNWLAVAGAGILALDWFYLMAVNSVA